MKKEREKGRDKTIGKWYHLHPYVAFHVIMLYMYMCNREERRGGSKESKKMVAWGMEVEVLSKLILVYR